MQVCHHSTTCFIRFLPPPTLSLSFPVRLRDYQRNSTWALLRRSARRPIDALFRRFAVEVFVVGLRVFTGMVDDAVPMIWRGVERIELQEDTAGIDDVVIRPRRDDDRGARSDRRPYAIEHRLPAPLLHAKELVERVDFRPDLFLGL
jgi:hypothetical protein